MLFKTWWSLWGLAKPVYYCYTHHKVTQNRHSLRTHVLYTMESLRAGTIYELLLHTPWSHSAEAKPDICCPTHHGVTQDKSSLSIAALHSMGSLRTGAFWEVLLCTTLKHSGQAQLENCCSTHHRGLNNRYKLRGAVWNMIVTENRCSLRTAISHTIKVLRGSTDWVLGFCTS